MLIYKIDVRYTCVNNAVYLTELSEFAIFTQKIIDLAFEVCNTLYIVFKCSVKYVYSMIK